ncbi:MAG: hypothetical protein ACYSTG_02025 [Planctomycetota bacterium]
MDKKNRQRRLRLLVSELNKERKRQAKKIDILCNDFIAAQREFIKSLGIISFTANFYESIVGITDLSTLILAASKLIKDNIPDSNFVFFLRQSENFELHMFGSNQPIGPEKQQLENCFTAELVSNICKSNKICSLDDMFAMGLEGKPTLLNKISAVTIPLGERGSAFGFVLAYRSSQNKLTNEEVNKIAAICPGLSRAVKSCQALLQPAD